MTSKLPKRHFLWRATVASSTIGVAMLLAAIATAPARAAFPGRNGKLVFETNRDGNAEIY